MDVDAHLVPFLHYGRIMAHGSPGIVAVGGDAGASAEKQGMVAFRAPVLRDIRAVVLHGGWKRLPIGHAFLKAEVLRRGGREKEHQQEHQISHYRLPNQKRL